MGIHETIYNCGIVPVIKLNDADNAVPLCRALDAGGINVAEVTFRTDAAAQAIKNISDTLPNILVGAGTVINTELAARALDAGARFIISPGFNNKLVEYCLERNVPVFPGVSSPTDIEKALDYGLTHLKFFPAEASGGVKALRAISAPYSMVKFIPTGGIDASNINDYLKHDNIIACGGSWMVSEQLINEKRFDEIAALARDAVMTVLGFGFAHLGINTVSAEQAYNAAQRFDDMFGFKKRITPLSAFADPAFEFMNYIGFGEHGHIGLRTNSVKRAMAYLERVFGVEFDMETLRGVPDKPEFVYLKESFNGFKLHLLQS